MRIRLLGPIEARDGDGRVLELGPRRQRAVLALLALTPGRVVGADRITFELWGDDIGTATANTLHAYVSRLRKVLGSAAIRTRAPGYVLDARPEDVDAIRFGALVEEARLAHEAGDPAAAARRLRDALELWAGPALADIASLPFAEREAALLEDARVRAVEDRIEADLELGRHGAVATELSGLIALHPLRERLYAQQMLALYRCNRQSDALATYEALRVLLVGELGVDPSPDVQHLRDSILRQKPELNWDAPVIRSREVRPASGALQSIVIALPESGSFVGRADEVAAITDAYRAVAAGGGRRVVIVAGEPGVGKTTVATHCARLMHGEGATVLFGRCDEGHGVPYKPFVEALTHLFAGVGVPADRPSLARIVPSLVDAPMSTTLDPEADRRTMFAAVSDTLVAASKRGPVALVMDDLHWADQQTLALLRHLVLAADAPGILIIATFRPADVPPDHPLRDLLAALRREYGVVRLDMEGWTRDDVATYLDLVGATSDAEHLFSNTEGNPFFVQAMVRHAAEHGGGEVPASIIDVLVDRVTRLGSDVRDVLDVASVAGRDFDATVVAAAAQLDLDVTVACLDVAVSAQIVKEDRERPGLFSFGHAIYRDALYGALGTTRTARLHRAIAEVSRTEAGEAARHWERALPFDPEKAAAAYETAGEQALSAVAGDIAVDWYRKALDLEPSDPRVRARLLTGLGNAQLQVGYKDFRRTLLSASRLALECGDFDQLVRAVAANTARTPAATSVDSECVAMLEEALRLTTGDSHGRARMMAALALALAFNSDLRRRESLASDAIAMARRLRDPLTLLRVLILVPGAVDAPQTLQMRLQIGIEARDLARAMDDLGAEFTAVSYLACSVLEAGRPEEARDAVDTCDDIAHRLRQPHALWWTYGWRAADALVAGDLELAEEMARDAVEVGRAAGVPDAPMGFASQTAEISRHRGDPLAMAPAFEQAMKLAPGVAAIRAELALLYADAGRSDDARALLHREASNGFADVGDDQLWMQTMACYADASATIADRAVAEDLLEILRPLRGRIAHSALVDRGAVSLYTGMLAGLLGLDDEADEDFRSASAMHERMRADLLMSRTQIEWGRTLAARGKTADARSLLDPGLETAQRCGSVWLVRLAEEAIPSRLGR